MSQSSISSVDFGPVAVSDAVYSYVTSSMQAALMALCLYDHFLTLDREVACIWKRKLSIASWLFLVNRYATLCCNMIAAVEMVVWNPQERRTADQVTVTSRGGQWTLVRS
ncbi:hypothetical protein BC629DRAFT_1188478 [Irpex lacteus]|nr:hypothetical protein BC629DRAFT_1188478 [Irpex lacteus]